MVKVIWFLQFYICLEPNNFLKIVRLLNIAKIQPMKI